MNTPPMDGRGDGPPLTNMLNRTVKMALDTGEARSLAEAERLFKGYCLRIAVGPDVARSATHQAALLTAVNTARRCFLGGVRVAGPLDAPLLVPWKNCPTLRAAVEDLQGQAVSPVPVGCPLIVIGDAPLPREAADYSFAVRATWNGWCGGVVPLSDGRRLPERQECPPAGVLAGSLAVSEAFQFVRKSNVRAGRRALGLSLWRPEAEVDWSGAREVGPALEWLPKKLWLVGLGHLGQAYLWTLGFLPYARPEAVELVLQDFDTLTAANDSTSPLTSVAVVGEKKTRAMARWCEGRGFRTIIQERRFDIDFRAAPDEPQVLLCGVDNPAARAALDEVGFAEVVEAGLGKGAEEYLAFQVHTFPAPRTARQRWGDQDNAPSTEALVSLPAYQNMAASGLDVCGLTQLAGRSVGASFVGTAASALVVAELLRMAMGAHRYTVADATLRNLSHRCMVAAPVDRPVCNIGVTEADGY